MLRDPSLIPLSHQHHNGLALCVLTERALAAGAPDGGIEKLARRIVGRYDIELVNHFEMEEQLLFPEFQVHAGPSPLVARLIEEHRRISAIVETLRNDPEPALIAEFCSVLRSHIRREENELFEQVQDRVPRAALDRIGEEIERRAVRVCL